MKRKGSTSLFPAKQCAGDALSDLTLNKMFYFSSLEIIKQQFLNVRLSTDGPMKPCENFNWHNKSRFSLRNHSFTKLDLLFGALLVLIYCFSSGYVI